jgi:hypothetical protein
MIESLLVLGLLAGPAPGDDAKPPAAPGKQEEKPAETLPAPLEIRAPALEDEDLPWIDFDWIEIQPRVGLALFTEDYHIDPSPYFSLLAHVPLTLLSPSSDPGGEYFGLFAEANFFPQVTRDIDPEPDNPSGSILVFNMGFDFTLLRNQSLYLVLQGGAQFAWYGGITDMNDGFGSMAGLSAGVYLGKGLTATLGSEVSFGTGGDRIYMNSLGLLIEF